ncbi:MAG: hypothetical protein LBS24_05670 [Clostridiales Family XIII bacterium]|jgi:hypothetical protein|nr:hypothetical protein [Clostridiales Family XIII bacterium]
MLKDDIIKDAIPPSPVTEEEAAMPLYKYFTRPLRPLTPLYSQTIRNGPFDRAHAGPTDDLTRHLLMPGEYEAVSLGYCQHPEGGGFFKHYSFYPGAGHDMIKWYYTWINIPVKGQPEGLGNMKYKIWCPAGHFTHAFINGTDNRNGVLTQESHGLGQHPGTPYDEPFLSVRYPFDIAEFGMTKVRRRELEDAGCWIDPAVIKYYEPEDYWEKGVLTEKLGTSIVIGLSRPAPGGVEKLSVGWVGWDIRDRKAVRNPATPWWKTKNDWLEMFLTHSSIEAQHLADILPELYAEYADKPVDAD